MSVLGLGCDIVELARIQRVLGKAELGAGRRFVQRVLTAKEQEEFEARHAAFAPRGVAYLATRYAAKEAFAKALGTGLGKQFSFQDLSVLNHASGAPRLEFSANLQNRLQAMQAEAHVSLSDEKPWSWPWWFCRGLCCFNLF
ncbi:MAG: holo-ACP synthase [Limnobacter sp.]|nr:holo-ACP synthase [Limnobacter sp.]